MIKHFVILLIFSIFLNSSFALELISAKTNSNYFEDGSVVSKLSGSVEFLWNETRIFADETVWKRGTGHLLMYGNIKVLRNRQELRCDTIEFRSSGKVLQLSGKVFGVDTNYSATIIAGKADYSIRNDSVYLERNPKIHFWDSTNTDTITIISKTMNYSSKTGIAQADKNVKITGTNFVGFADTGLYFAQTEKGLLIGNPRIEYLDESSVKGDSIHIIFKENALKEFFVVGKPIGNTRNEENGDSVFMELTGDTLRFLLGEKQIDKIISEQNAIVKRFKKDTEETADKMWGQNITTTIHCNENCGDTDKITSVVSGEAKAIYYDGNTKNESAGDTLKLFFNDAGVSKVRILGQVSGRVEN